MKTFIFISIALALCGTITCKTSSREDPIQKMLSGGIDIETVVDEIFSLPLQTELSIFNYLSSLQQFLPSQSPIVGFINNLFNALQDRVNNFSANTLLSDSIPFKLFLEKAVDFQNQILYATSQAYHPSPSDQFFSSMGALFYPFRSSFRTSLPFGMFTPANPMPTGNIFTSPQPQPHAHKPHRKNHPHSSKHHHHHEDIFGGEDEISKELEEDVKIDVSAESEAKEVEKNASPHEEKKNDNIESPKDLKQEEEKEQSEPKDLAQPDQLSEPKEQQVPDKKCDKKSQLNAKKTRQSRKSKSAASEDSQQKSESVEEKSLEQSQSMVPSSLEEPKPESAVAPEQPKPAAEIKPESSPKEPEQPQPKDSSEQSFQGDQTTALGNADSQTDKAEGANESKPKSGESSTNSSTSVNNSPRARRRFTKQRSIRGKGATPQSASI